MPVEIRGEWRDGWYVVPQHVVFRDLDAFGHVNNAVYFSFFEWARALVWFELTGGSRARDIGFIVAHASCDFRKQLDLEPIEVCTRISAVGSSSLTFLHEVRKNGGSEVAAAGKVIVVLFDWEKQSKMSVSDELRKKVAEWNADAS